ncbi:MAG: TIGR03067 domain-containing protein [Vicinamibacterales bacterium]
MTRFFIAVTVIALAGNVLAQETKEVKGAAALQGTWVISSINGQSAPEGSPEMTLTFTGEQYSQAVGGEVNERGTVKIDAAKQPMTIDLAIVEGADAGKTQLGIFEITGAAIRAVLDTPGAQQRPKDFMISEGSIMFVGKKKG